MRRWSPSASLASMSLVHAAGRTRASHASARTRRCLDGCGVRGAGRAENFGGGGAGGRGEAEIVHGAAKKSVHCECTRGPPRGSTHIDRRAFGAPDENPNPSFLPSRCRPWLRVLRGEGARREIEALLTDAFKASLARRARAGALTIKSYTVQVVAGTNYLLQLEDSAGKAFSAKIHKPLPHTGAPPELMECGAA